MHVGIRHGQWRRCGDERNAFDHGDDEEQGHHLPAFAQSLANEFGEW